MKHITDDILELKATNGLNYTLYVPDIYRLVKYKKHGKHVYQVEYIDPTDDGTNAYMEELNITRKQYQELNIILDRKVPV